MTETGVDVDREVDGIGWRLRWLVHRPLARWALRSSARAPQRLLRQPIVLLPTVGGSVFMVGLVLGLVGVLPAAAQIAVACACVAVWVLLDLTSASMVIGQPDIPLSYLLVQGSADRPRVGRRAVSELTRSIWTQRLGVDGYAVYREALDVFSRMRVRQLMWFWASVPAAYLILLPGRGAVHWVGVGWFFVVVVARALRQRRSTMPGELRSLIGRLGQELGFDDLDRLPRLTPAGYDAWLAAQRARADAPSGAAAGAVPSPGAVARRIASGQVVVLLSVALVTFAVAGGVSLARKPPPKQPSEIVAQLSQAGICHGVTTMESSHSNLYRCFDDNGGLITVADLTTIVPSQPSDYAVYGDGWIAVVSHQGTADRVAELLDGRVSPPLG